MIFVAASCIEATNTNQYLCGTGKRNGTQRRTKVTPFCMHYSCCGWRKGTSRAKATANSEEIINPVTLTIVELCLARKIQYKLVGWSEDNFGFGYA